MKKETKNNGDGVMGIVASGDLADGDTVGLKVRAAGNADIILRNGQFRALKW